MTSLQMSWDTELLRYCPWCTIDEALGETCYWIITPIPSLQLPFSTLLQWSFLLLLQLLLDRLTAMLILYHYVLKLFRLFYKHLSCATRNFLQISKLYINSTLLPSLQISKITVPSKHSLYTLFIIKFVFSLGQRCAFLPLPHWNNY